MKCCKCGMKIEGGYYNAPSGVYCTYCWENKPKESRKAEENMALKERLLVGLTQIMGKK